MSQRKVPPGRGSSSCERPIHCTILSGSVKNSKTVSGLASIRTSISTAAAVSALATLVPPLLLELRGQLQPLESVGPETIQEVTQLGEALGPGAVEAARAFAPLGQQAGPAQHRQMLGYRRSRDVEMRGDLAGAQLAIPDQ